jgi:hypothetical protein
MSMTGRIPGLAVLAGTVLMAFGLVVWNVGGAGAEQWHTSPACWKQPRAFQSPFDPQFADRIVVESMPLANPSQQIGSPNGAYWFSVQSPDFTKEAPWTTQVLIFNERPTLIRLALRDHGNVQPTVSWVNEKLLFLRVSWGRILDTDMIFDVEEATFLSREMRWWGAIAFQQFRGQPCPGERAR